MTDVPQTVEGAPQSSMLGNPEESSHFENPGGGTEPTLNRGVEGQISKGGSNVVYKGINKETGEVNYIGITERTPEIRFQEHLNSTGTGKEFLNYEVIPGATAISWNGRRQNPAQRD